MQTSYVTDMALAYPGMLADARVMKHVESRMAVGTLNPGLAAFRVPGYGSPGPNQLDPGQVYQLPVPANAAAATAILASGGASAATSQTISGAALNGATGGTEMFPSRQVTLVLSNHTDWDATNAILTYIDEAGVTRTETLAIPNNGNATVTSTGYVAKVVSLFIPAQTGTGGTFTIGVAVLDASIVLADLEGIVLFTSGMRPTSTTYMYGDGFAVPVLVKGAIWANPEVAVVAGDPVYVRTAGTGLFGALRNDADTANAFQIPNARWERAASGGGLSIVELY